MTDMTRVPSVLLDQLREAVSDPNPYMGFFMGQKAAKDFLEAVDAVQPTAEDEPTMNAFYYEPSEPGWYAYSGGAQSMIFHLRGRQWSVHLDNGSAADCEWGYINQALGVWNLVRIDLPPAVCPTEAEDDQRTGRCACHGGECKNPCRSLIEPAVPRVASSLDDLALGMWVAHGFENTLGAMTWEVFPCDQSQMDYYAEKGGLGVGTTVILSAPSVPTTQELPTTPGSCIRVEHQGFDDVLMWRTYWGLRPWLDQNGGKHSEDEFKLCEVLFDPAAVAGDAREQEDRA